jgi:hypothetical protein
MVAVDTSKMNISKVVWYGEFVQGKIKEADEKLSLVKEKSFLWVYTQKSSAIASGATTIGSAGRAPDDIIESRYDLMTWKKAHCLWAYTQNKFFRL